MTTTASDRQQEMLAREQIANRKKHWVRLVTACNSKCLFCLDADTPRNVYIPIEQIKAELDRGRSELDADKVILSGGEGSLHPKFFDAIRYAKEIGYDRVQTVTNGWNYADKDFYEGALEAGLGEITFSLHGHTEELHDHLTQHPGSFKRICKAILRAARDRRIISNVDVVINGLNVAHIDKIVELAIRMGIHEFDLLHVIPQSNAFRNRDTMFYDVRDHLEKLQKVFKLNRHPGFYIWTNRFPIPFLEGLEDLIQDPHKMIDEVNGRRFQVGRYLDEGVALDCREPERCQHCFIEPFCTTMDRVVARQRAKGWEVWWVGRELDDPRTAPPGVKQLGVHVASVEDLPALFDRTSLGIYAQVDEPGPIEPRKGLTLVADTGAHLEAWIDQHDLVVHLNTDTAVWMLANRDRVEKALPRLHLHQPSHEKMAQAAESDVRTPAGFFLKLNLPIRTSGLAACMAPNTKLVDEPAILPANLYDAERGRLHWKDLAKYHIAKRYRGKSTRCADCRLNDRCEGIAINMIRDQGLKQARPLVSGDWADEAEKQLVARFPEPPLRLANGRPTEPVVDSLPGYAPPTEATKDPLAVIHLERQAKWEARKARDEARIAAAAAED